MKVRLLVLSLLMAVIPTLVLAQSMGTAYFSSTTNWSQTPDLYFTVTGAPASMCGDLITTRNGSLLNSPGWICTDSSGNVTKGPWTWANTPGDQTDTNVQIYWANGSTTYATSDHVWDKSCPVHEFTSPSGAPPTSLAGDAIDNTWSAGFDDGWTDVRATFYDVTTGLFWNGSGYVAGFVDEGAAISRMPSHYITWSVSQLPPPSAHVPGHSYSWVVTLHDGDTGRCNLSAIGLNFTY